jgi:hypothetical protein
MEHEVDHLQHLLDAKGHIVEEGWARHPLWHYDRTQIKGGKLKIKEWDYYAIINQQKGYAIALTISDLGYAALFAIAYIDFHKKAVSQCDSLSFLPLGKLGLAPSSQEESHVSWADKKLRLAFIKKGQERHLMAACPQMVLPDGTEGLDIDITLVQERNAESLNIATSWKEQRKAFYLNEKLNCLAAKGTVRRGLDVEHLLLGEAWGVLDWGRGRWTYTNTWYWASLSALVENVPFGLNLGYGFSDRTPASENAIIYNHVIHKLGNVTFTYDKEHPENPWDIRDTEGRLKLTFTPLVDRSSTTNFVLIKSNQHQYFGTYSGMCILDEGTTVSLEGVLGFAEEVYNRW